jgi:hypothetical protein
MVTLRCPPALPFPSANEDVEGGKSTASSLNRTPCAGEMRATFRKTVNIDVRATLHTHHASSDASAQVEQRARRLATHTCRDSAYVSRGVLQASQAKCLARVVR